MAKKLDTLSMILPKEELNGFALEVQPGQTPLWEYWTEFIPRYLRTGKSSETVNSVRDTLRILLRHTPLRSIEQFNDPAIFEDVLYELRDKRKITNSTMNTYLKNIKTYFIWLHKRGLIKENNLGRICKGTEKRGWVKVSSIEEVQRARGYIFEKSQSNLERWRNLFFFEILCFVGARPIEMERLNLDSIRATQKGVKICIEGAKQKGANRYYNLPTRIVSIWESYMKERQKAGIKDNSLLSSNTKKARWTRKGMTRFLTRLANTLGFEMSGYTLRRFVATKLFEGGMPIEKIAAYLGHTRISTTWKYIEESCIRTKDAGKVMNAVLMD